jgi:hypothetical protein
VTGARRRVLTNRVLIGCTEEVDFPEWNIHGVVARVDTGARTSALHVEEVLRIGRRMVRFRVVSGDGPGNDEWVETRIARVARVRSSTGDPQVRYFVKTEVRIGEVIKDVELSLAAREPMRYRMLLGRTALAGTFVVDPGRYMVATKRVRAAMKMTPHREDVS